MVHVSVQFSLYGEKHRIEVDLQMVPRVGEGVFVPDETACGGGRWKKVIDVAHNLLDGTVAIDTRGEY